MSQQIELLPAAPTTRAEAPPDRVPRPSPCPGCSDLRSRNQHLVTFVERAAEQGVTGAAEALRWPPALGTPEARAALRWPR